MDDEIPESLIRLSQDSMVLAKVCAANAELAVAQVLEVLEVRLLPMAMFYLPDCKSCFGQHGSRCKFDAHTMFSRLHA